MKTRRSMDGRTSYGFVETAAGPVTCGVAGGAVVEVFLGKRTEGGGDPLLARALAQIGEYFSGERAAFDLPYAFSAAPFTTRVLRAVAAIPYGEVRSYKDVACAAGNPQAARAAGQAVGANPLPLLIPCHRVVASNGIGGFGGGLRWKRFLLELETAIPASRG